MGLVLQAEEAIVTGTALVQTVQAIRGNRSESLGIEIIENIYSYLYETPQEVTAELHTYHLVKLPESMTLSVGESLMAIPRVQPLWYNGLTLEVTGDLKLEYPCTVVGVQPGSGTIVLKNGDTVLQTVNITVTE